MAGFLCRLHHATVCVLRGAVCVVPGGQEEDGTVGVCNPDGLPGDGRFPGKEYWSADGGWRRWAGAAALSGGRIDPYDAAQSGGAADEPSGHWDVETRVGRGAGTGDRETRGCAAYRAGWVGDQPARNGIFRQRVGGDAEGIGKVVWAGGGIDQAVSVQCAGGGTYGQCSDSYRAV